jgi:hypothetical protein
MKFNTIYIDGFSVGVTAAISEALGITDGSVISAVEVLEKTGGPKPRRCGRCLVLLDRAENGDYCRECRKKV